ncbi:Coenzyme F420 hydrogenase/dehydrogenase, beta subunit C-terminal domain [Clostridium kluyveri]|uniref:Coenzyme F420 hydrogenase/dehydrogenase, beta subunit C-terminal domain n=1 Tax=Clostridium kluyveri TaxID=1534 RepID=UPI0022475171|nr:Coenzyme F420 hydrogenase/dehydrogenase, beta subunit C-terminal domain [Clostridium kluyveri]UZQ50363.1 Coenzyme F420 hydrogenase/dehydrogenase, beta subunit C-terminal domain [Clostridium kluyveri]
MFNRIILYNDKKECCACGACMNICPNNAILMGRDEYGFLYPQIDYNVCVNCGICKKVCAYQNINGSKLPMATYAGGAKSSSIMNSASGGIFLAMAISIIEGGGVVFGASFKLVEGILRPIHIGISNEEQIYKLQGSKYVQSDIGFSYRKIKNLLLKGKKVLFSGTPCQVDGLKGYLNKEYDNLLLIDIICHGVPNAQFFQDYLVLLGKSNYGEIIDFKFREKSKGWGLNGVAECRQKNGEYKKFVVSSRLSSFYRLFLDSEIYRDSCYSCKYASCHRAGDVTIGDYWGIKEEHPEFIDKNGGDLTLEKGISCIIVNSEKGYAFLNDISESIFLYPSSYEKVSAHNSQLVFPSHVGKNRNKILELYRKKGYKGVHRYFNRKVGYHRIIKFKLLNYLNNKY